MAALPACGAKADDAAGGLPLPDGVRPFGTPIELAYAEVDRFTFVFRSDIELPSGQRMITEGWAMDGDVRRDGGALVWSYRLSNIGRDGIERERGSLRVRTDAWGAVQEARVLEDRWASRPGRPPIGADAMFSERELAFPLCCCPRGPIRMGDVLRMPPATMTMPGAELPSGPMPPEAGDLRMSFRGQSTVAGVLVVDGRRLLVVRHVAESRATVTGEGAMAMRRSGYTLLDTRTCLPRRTVWRSRYEFAGEKLAPGAITTWHTQTMR
jgi:hypothetical protein